MGSRLSLAAGSGLAFGSFGHQGLGCRVCHEAVENQMDKKRETDMAPIIQDLGFRDITSLGFGNITSRMETQMAKGMGKLGLCKGL